MEKIIEAIIKDDVTCFEEEVKKEISRRIYGKIEEMKKIVAHNMFSRPSMVEEDFDMTESQIVDYLVEDSNEEEIPKEVMDQLSPAEIKKFETAAKKMIMAIKLKNFDFEDEDGKLEKAFFRNMVRMKTQTGSFEDEDKK